RAANETNPMVARINRAAHSSNQMVNRLIPVGNRTKTKDKEPAKDKQRTRDTPPKTRAHLAPRLMAVTMAARWNGVCTTTKRTSPKTVRKANRPAARTTSRRQIKRTNRPIIKTLNRRAAKSATPHNPVVSKNNPARVRIQNNKLARDKQQRTRDKGQRTSRR